MEELIEETLLQEFEYIRFNVQYKQLHTYKIDIILSIIDDKRIIRARAKTFDYNWRPELTDNFNLSCIIVQVENEIKSIFKKKEV